MSARLRIFSANLWLGTADPDALAGLLEEERVDVACLQELSPEQAEAVASVLPYGELRPESGADGGGIALRAPARLDTTPFTRRALFRAGLDPKDWPGLPAPLQVWNLHVWAPHDVPPRSLWIRRAQLRELRAALAACPEGPLLLAGDFNSTPLWPFYHCVTAELPDAVVELARREGRRPQRTWAPWTGARRLRLLRIDHLFARGARLRALRRLHVPGSDHDALCADLELV